MGLNSTMQIECSLPPSLDDVGHSVELSQSLSFFKSPNGGSARKKNVSYTVCSGRRSCNRTNVKKKLPRYEKCYPEIIPAKSESQFRLLGKLG